MLDPEAIRIAKQVGREMYPPKPRPSDEPPPHEAWPEGADGERDETAEAAESAKQQAKAAPASRWQDQIAQDRKIKTVRFRTLLEEIVTEEPNYIEPNFAGPGQFVVIAGPPKAQKSFALQEMLVACATGGSFLMSTFRVPRPLRVFYLQAEMNRRLLRDRARQFTDLTPAELELLGENLVISERFHMLLGEEGVKKVVEQIHEDFPDAKPDILAFDPLANLFDGDDENSNSQLLKFLMTRLEEVRRLVNPEAVIVLTHHSKKVSREDLAKDPFSAIRGAGALRGYYDSAIVIFRINEDAKDRQFHFEMRSGEAPAPLKAVLTNGRFTAAALPGSLDKSMARKMLADLKSAWDKNEPWSPNRQARRDGRYAVYNLARGYDAKPAEITALMDEWARLGIITMRDRVSRKHSAGFEVTGTLD
jgi:AAA domain-containing protein